jgi:hypothetical protein
VDQTKGSTHLAFEAHGYAVAQALSTSTIVAAVLSSGSGCCCCCKNQSYQTKHGKAIWQANFSLPYLALSLHELAHSDDLIRL